MLPVQQVQPVLRQHTIKLKQKNQIMFNFLYKKTIIYRDD